MDVINAVILNYYSLCFSCNDKLKQIYNITLVDWYDFILRNKLQLGLLLGVENFSAGGLL